MTAQVEAFSASETGVSAGEIRQFIERIERLSSEADAIKDDIKDVFTELKGRGYDAKAIRTILKLRKLDASEREEQEAIVELYMSAIGMA
jgi:uncharacterized protein (UPF0335 family)